MSQRGASAPAKKSNFVGAMGNFSIQYNFSCLSIAVAIMTSHQDVVVQSGDALAPDYPEPGWTKFTLLGLVFAGSVVGMICMGYIGDLLGRRAGMAATLSLVVLGALASALLPWGEPETVYILLCICRFLIGFGVGGIYPMAAATAAESSGAGEHQATRVGQAFFWQAPGAMAPYAVAWVLLQIPAFDGVTSLQFRLLLGLGALPAFLVLWATLKQPAPAPSTAAAVAAKPSPLEVARAHPEHFVTLIGTAGTWFLYDISFYGTAIFTPQILKSIFGSQESLDDLCWQSLIVSGMGVPGCLLGISQLKSRGARWLNIWGFILMAALFAALAICYNVDEKGLSSLKFAIFCFLTFSFNYGPNPATYVLPAEAFPVEVRTTFHGLSAAAGKIGAVVGTFIYTPIANASGFASVMWLQFALSVLGAIVSVYCIAPTVGASAAVAAAAAKDSGEAAGDEEDEETEVDVSVEVETRSLMPKRS